LKINDQSKRIIYPYFAEEPSLPEEGRRLGIAILSRGLTDYAIEDLRVLDILRASSYGTVDHELIGNEYEIFVQRYRALLQEWKRLREGY
jgi:hypothetical protein